MNDFLSRLDALVDDYSLLRHPFFQRWSLGRLTETEFRTYALEYYQFCRMVPTFVSAVHSHCRHQGCRLAILEALVEIETGGEGLIPWHEMWASFAGGMGVSRSQLDSECSSVATKKLILTYRNLADASASVVGASALYALESQWRRMAPVMLESLQMDYDIEDRETLRFFRESVAADGGRTQIWAAILIELASNPDLQQQAESAALKAMGAHWAMLDGVCDSCGIPAAR